MLAYSPEDIEQRVEEIYDVLANNDILQAIKRLMDLATDFAENPHTIQAVVQISSDYQNLLEIQKNSEVLPENFREKRKTLVGQIFELIDEIHTHAQTDAHGSDG